MAPPHGLARTSPSESTSSPKRRKIAFDSEHNNGERDDLMDSYAEEPTLPSVLKPTQSVLCTNSFSSIPTQPLIPASPSPPSSFVTQPTQPLPSQPSTPRRAPTVQVPASSPFQYQQSSPLKPASPVRPNPINSFSRHCFLHQAKPGNVQLDVDGPQYIGSSSDDESSQHTVKPVFGGAVKRLVPSASAIHKLPVQSLPQTVPASPVSFAQFAYKPPVSSPKPKVGRLDSLKRPALPPGMSIAAALQRRPEPALPNADTAMDSIPEGDKLAVERMKVVFPDMSISLLHNMFRRHHGNYDNAVEAIVKLKEANSIDLTKDDDKNIATTLSKTANRGAGAGKVAIKDKWSSTQAARINNISFSPPAAAPARKRKLVRGSNRTSRERSATPLPQVILDDSDSEVEEEEDSEDERQIEDKVLKYINACSVKELSDIACTTEEIANTIISQRPYKSLDAIRSVSLTAAPTSKKGRGKGRTKAIGEKVIDVCLETMRGYVAVDSLINKVEQLGKPIAESIRAWGVDVQTGTETGELAMTDIMGESDSASAKDSGIGTPTDDGDTDIKGSKRAKTAVSFKQQPANMREGVELKDYQLAGLNWLNLLYEKKLSCILADEMGLGKTCQVISFFAHLLTQGIKGPHLVVVPSSTLENWLREFANFCPALKVEPYYGLQKERPMMREALRKDRSWNVLVTTYQLATGDKNDRGFLKSLRFNCCVYDEGHLLKNGSSNRYDALIKLPADFRLLLTGTPLQNNLQELASLLAFILPSVFDEKKADLASIFKYKAKTTDDEETNNALLSQQRIARARAMMTPFVLRRKKTQVLKHLPVKTNRVEYCEMNKSQYDLYTGLIATAAEAIALRAEGKKPDKNATSNVMMQLRKAAIHPLLFRTNYPDEKLRKMAKDIMKEEQYKAASLEHIVEDMQWMSDYELSKLCLNFPKTIGKYALKKQEWMDSGKVQAFKNLLLNMKENGDRVLVFSQFTQVMDLLEQVLTTLDMGYLRIDGNTPVEARQDLIDQYHSETDIMVFLLSTKAGGFGINLACANKVIIFDSSFNPHDDAQASDRAHRVGQTRAVEVIRLVTKNTIEEQILQLANTKLALDQSISEGDDKVEGQGEQMVAKMLLAAKGFDADKADAEKN
ncbi:SNF2 family N-terminal domain-containing protein [Sphaerosporella brunnea]|uniref:DNA helicase n=1 Tax=Sphaerosporella brunnea TaxID=1250544 RepID=A0A5J5EL35_9PEZI|nr:SNF2 family N-terminal domain-containing protein [Sphaerosporella brunnea]